MTHNSYYIPLYKASMLYARNNIDSFDSLSVCKWDTPNVWNYPSFKGAIKKSLETRWLEENDKLFMSNDFTREDKGKFYSIAFVSVTFNGGLKEYTLVSSGSYYSDIVKLTLNKSGLPDKQICKELEDKPILFDENGNIVAVKYIKKFDPEKKGKDIKEECKFSQKVFDELAMNQLFPQKGKEDSDSFSNSEEPQKLFTVGKYFDCYRNCDGYYFMARNNEPYKNIRVDENNDNKLDKDEEKNALHLRRLIYQNGFDLDGHHYVRYKRSAGSSREGSCLFIAEDFVNRETRSKNHPDYSTDILINEWTNCGIDETLARATDAVSWEAYRSLTLSGCQSHGPDFITIKKNEILVLHDGVSSFDDSNVVPINCNKDSDGNTTIFVDTISNKGITIENKIWDGEGLLDESAFNDAFKGADRIPGMMLLRNRFFKNCAFNTKLQKWFNDNGIRNISDLNGVSLAKSVEEIKLVITESSLKYIKLRKAINKKQTGKDELDFKAVVKEWLEQLDDTFAIVKTDKPTHYLDGKLVRTNYQIINTLEATQSDIDNLLVSPFDYLDKISNKEDFFMFHLKSFKTKQVEDTYDVSEEYDSLNDYFTEDDDSADNNGIYSFNDTAMNLLEADASLFKTKALGEFRRTARETIRNEWYLGKVMVDGTYAVLFGNGYELLNACLKKSGWDEKKDVKCISCDCLTGNQVYSRRFSNDEELLCARSPHITMGNLLYVTNKHINEYDKYFNLTDEIICVNSIENNLLQRLNGCDFDSDTMLVTNNPILVKTGKSASQMPVPVNQMKDYPKNVEGLYTLDSDVSNNSIGEIVNLSQKLNCIYWTKYHNCAGSEYIKRSLNEIYEDICVLSVLSNTEIDKAKRDYGIKAKKEIARIKAEYSNINDLFAIPNFIEDIKNSDKDLWKTSESKKEKKGDSKEDKTKNEYESPMTMLFSAVDKKAHKDQHRIGAQPTDMERCLSYSLCGKVASELPIPKQSVVNKAREIIIDTIKQKRQEDNSSKVNSKSNTKKERQDDFIANRIQFFSEVSKKLDEDTVLEIIRICDLDIVYELIKAKTTNKKANSENKKERRKPKQELKEKLLKQNRDAGYVVIKAPNSKEDIDPLDVSKCITLLISAMCYEKNPVLLNMLKKKNGSRIQKMRVKEDFAFDINNTNEMSIYGYQLEYIN